MPPLLYLIFSFLLGAALTLSGLVFLPGLITRLFKSKKKVWEVVFRIDYYQQPSLYNSNAKGQLIKSQPITVRISAGSEQEALHLLDDIIKEETKGELVRIKEVKEKPEPAVMIAKKNP